jgi:FtsP/CotA-like multicopper oxidase with cupredoxin domain
MKITRRRMLQLGLSSGFALALPRVSKAWSSGGSSGNYGGGGTGVPAFSLPLAIPPVLAPSTTDATTDYYTLTQSVAQQQIIPGKMTTIWGYNGHYPGPTIKARAGRRVVVHQINNLPESISVHLHGGHTPPDSDGHPNALVAPGASRDYTYPNNQLPTTLWYHDHAVDNTGRHVYMGLAGFYLMSDATEDALPLPNGTNDVPLLLQDRLFNSDGSLSYASDDRTLDEGFLGDTMMVNGVIQPYFQVARRKMRFRILNGSNARVYSLSLSSGKPFIQIGSDGGLLSAPVSRTSISLAPAERIDVVIDFSQYAIGTSVTLRNGDSENNYSYRDGYSSSWRGSSSGVDLMRFDVARDETDTSSIPTTLRTVTRIPTSAASKSRTFTLDKSWNNGRNQWTINGNTYDPARIDAVPALGSTEIWKFDNRSGQSHPLHIHDVQFQIVDINGSAPSAGDSGWKDTVLVPERGSARVIMKFADLTGVYVFHCHKLEHEDHAMMSQFKVT